MPEASRKPRTALKSELRPVDGEFKASAEERKAACKALGHPLILLNLPKSSKAGRDIKRCICGEAETA